MIGTTISHYKILERLGGGGMGVVYKAHDVRLKRTVALKFLPPDLTRDPEAKERFIHEAQAASSLQHNNICNIHDIDETDDGQMFIVMDCYEGETLKSRIANCQSRPERLPADKGQIGQAGSRGMRIDEATDIAVQVAQGLQKAHEKGIVHRDIKPANIIITTDGVVKILDFGVAKLAGQGRLTKTGSTVGTAAYMSPEQARGVSVDHRTDIWSLGVVFYEMVTGRQPFKSEYEQALVYSILNEEPEPITRIRHDAAPQVESIVTKATRKEQRGRYQTINEMLEDLRSLQEKLQTETSGKRLAAEKAQPSIAVLPFANLSADPDNEYFSDGMSEEIINALTKIIGLHVVARTSAFAFKGKQEDIREIGRKLHVEHVLEGSVRKAGSRLRITAQLIKVADGYHLWSERFDRAMDDVFAIQDEISMAIVDKLKVSLLEAEIDALAKRSTENLEAYNLFLQGLYSLHKKTRESLLDAVQRFQGAVSLAPDYAEAYSKIGVAYYNLGLLTFLPAGDAFPKAKAAALKAIEINPTAADAQGLLAMIKLQYDWDWEGAESGFKRAIEQNPNDFEARVQYALYYTCMGRMNEALAEMKIAYSFDPLLDPLDLGWVLLRMGRLDEARGAFQKSLELEPGRAHSLWLLGHIEVLQGRHEEGLAEIRRALSLSGNNVIILAGFGWSNALAGKRSEALQVLEEFRERSMREPIPPFCYAKIYSALGENNLAFEWLEKAYDQREPAMVFILTDESLKGVHEDPRFNELLGRMRLHSSNVGVQ